MDIKGSKITEEEVINEKSAVHQKTLLLLATVDWEGDPILVVLGSVLAQSVEQVHDFTYPLLTSLLSILRLFHPHLIHLLHHPRRLFGGGIGCFIEADPEDVISEGIEAPTGQDQLMPALRVLADHSEQQTSVLVKYFELLEVLNPAATVQNSLLDYPPNKPLLIPDFHCGTIGLATAKVGLPNSLIGDVLVVIFANYFPRSVRSRQEYPEKERNSFFKDEVDVTIFVVGVVSGGEFVLIG